MNSRRWTEEDVDRAFELYQSGLSAVDIARMLGRTESGLRFKLYICGVANT